MVKHCCYDDKIDGKFSDASSVIDSTKDRGSLPDFSVMAKPMKADSRVFFTLNRVSFIFFIEL